MTSRLCLKFFGRKKPLTELYVPLLRFTLNIYFEFIKLSFSNHVPIHLKLKNLYYGNINENDIKSIVVAVLQYVIIFIIIAA